MKIVCVFLILLICAWDHAAERPPNIVYIIADDQSWSDFGFMGNESVHTPNLDLLAAKSARFVNGYLPTSVCRPSLVTLLTGLYPHQHKIYFNHGPPGNSGYNKMTSAADYVEVRSREFEYIKNLPTLPRILSRELGYRCFQTGKFWEGHWRNGGFTEGMTVFEAPSPEQTFGGIRVLASGKRVAHGNGDRGLLIGRETMQPIRDFVLECEEAETPWMVWYAPYLPHQPHDSPEKFFEIAKGYPGVEEHEVPYYASIAQFDDTVGELINFVEEESDISNTLFVFVSDNGWAPSTHKEKRRPQEYAPTRTSKRAPFDEGVRSPILIRWDGVVEPASREELVSSIDIVPTLVEAVGATGPELPGLNLLKPLPGNRSVFGEIYPGDGSVLGRPELDIAYRWVRQGQYKLIVPTGSKPWGNYLQSSALFRVSTDPGEKENLFGLESLTEIRESLEDQLEEWLPVGGR